MNNNPAAAANNMAAEFFDFLKQFGVIGLAIGVVVGGAVKTFVDEIVTSLVTPVVNRILELVKFKPGGIISLGGVDDTKTGLLIGDFIGSTINFLVLMLIVFIVVKFFISKFMGETDKKNAGV
jgi:large conductance mechanosensitive channel